MANPKKKHTRMRTGMRRAANWTVSAAHLTRCTNCGAPKKTHHVCQDCGFYNGELLLPRKTKKKKDEGEQQG